MNSGTVGQSTRSVQPLMKKPEPGNFGVAGLNLTSITAKKTAIASKVIHATSSRQMSRMGSELIA